MALWLRLSQIRSLRFVAQGSAHSGWSGYGEGTVVVAAPKQDVLTFAEAGLWQPAQGKSLPFHNVYRWTHLAADRIRLEHLRFGPEKPVSLFDLEEISENQWHSVEPHLCRDDEYTARLTLGEGALTLDWTVAGPRKSERITYDTAPFAPTEGGVARGDKVRAGLTGFAVRFSGVRFPSETPPSVGANGAVS